MEQFCITTSMGKRIIGKGMAAHPDIRRVLETGTLVIIAGTTNGYVAEEVLKGMGQAEEFSRLGFRRGISVAPGARVPAADFSGDVVITDGRWQPGKTIFDMTDDLQEGDVVLKGANAFDARGYPAVQIFDPRGGTIMAALAAVIGRRVRLIMPVGLEKRVLEPVNDLAGFCNAPGSTGLRLFPVPGKIFTELDAIRLLTGAEVRLIAGGGIYGAEGASWLGVSGSGEQVQAVAMLLKSVADELPAKYDYNTKALILP